MNIETKRGISLITLSIIITVMIILAYIVISNSNTGMDAALTTSFVEGITTIESEVKSYYLLNKAFPLPDAEGAVKVYTQSDLSQLAGNNGIIEEINLNGDTDESFYVVNLSLLDVQGVSNGTSYNLSEENKNNNIYVISATNFNAYYVAGVEIGNDRYYSASSKLIGISKNSSNISEDMSATTIDSITYNSRINILEKEGVESKLDAEVYIQIEEDETVSVETTNYTSELSVELGENVFTLRNILTDDQMVDINENKVYTIKIMNGTDVVQQRNVSVDKLTSSAPTISSENTLHSYTDENTISFTVQKGDSEIEYIKYDYYNVFDTVSGVIAYHKDMVNAQDIVDYVKENGKKVNIDSEGNCTISVPKYVKDIVVIVKDTSGNVTYMSKTVSNIYAKAFVANMTKDSTRVKSFVIAPIGTGVRLSYSKDNVTYSAGQSYTTISEQEKIEMSFNNVSTPYVYVKTVIRIDSDNYEFVDKLDLTEASAEVSD